MILHGGLSSSGSLAKPRGSLRCAACHRTLPKVLPEVSQVAAPVVWRRATRIPRLTLRQHDITYPTAISKMRWPKLHTSMALLRGAQSSSLTARATRSDVRGRKPNSEKYSPWRALGKMSCLCELSHIHARVGAYKAHETREMRATFMNMYWRLVYWPKIELSYPARRTPASREADREASREARREASNGGQKASTPSNVFVLACVGVR